MRKSPADRARRKSMRRAALSSAKTGEGFHFVGFDWEPHFSTPTMLDADILLNAMSNQCFRAIVRVVRQPDGQLATIIVEVGGDEHVYGYTFDSAMTSGRWSIPVAAQALDLMYLRRE